MSLTHTDTHPHEKQLSEIRGLTVDMAILQWFNVLLIKHISPPITSEEDHLPFMLDATDAMLIMFPDFFANI